MINLGKPTKPINVESWDNVPTGQVPPYLSWDTYQKINKLLLLQYVSGHFSNMFFKLVHMSDQSGTLRTQLGQCLNSHRLLVLKASLSEHYFYLLFAYNGIDMYIMGNEKEGRKRPWTRTLEIKTKNKLRMRKLKCIYFMLMHSNQ